MSANTSSDNSIVLQMIDVDKHFAGVNALKKCCLNLKKGEIHGLIGENGAGKSTLAKTLAGIYQPDSGRIIFNGADIQFKSPKEAQKTGISSVHQDFKLMNHLTAAQNIFIGRESKGFVLNDNTINQETQKLFDYLKIPIYPTDKVGSLTLSKQQMIEIAKALSFVFSVLILDEPSTSLTEPEIAKLFNVIRGLKEKGIAILYISHRMEEIMEFTDRITVMRDGEIITTLNTKDTNTNEIVNAMIGHTIYEEPKAHSNIALDAPVVLEVKNLVSKDVKNVSFQLHKGEIVGFAGLIGAGRTETARLIIGADPITGGEIYRNSKLVHIKSPVDAVKAGIGYLSEDKIRLGLAAVLPVTDNVVLADLEHFSKFGVVDDKKVKAVTSEYVDKLSIKTLSINQLVRNLSGGNQQKVIIARWLVKNSDILIFDEPTKGIDVGAKEEIYKLMNKLVAAGKSIIMISSELQEILRMSDRIYCMYEGKITASVDIQEASQELIMKYITTRN